MFTVDWHWLFSATVVFQATGTQKSSFSDGEIVVFPTVTYNEGSGYNRVTGKFTAPASGVYAFTKQTCTHNNYALTAFVHNTNNLLASEISSTGYSCSSAHVFVQMSRGEQLWVKTTSSTFLYVDAVAHASFSGVLMHD